MTSQSRQTVQHPFVCPLCKAHCGVILEVDVLNQRVLSSKGDRDDPFGKGYNGIKAHALTTLEDDPDLVRRPLKRRGGDFEEVAWEAAFAEIADRTKALRKQ